MKKRYTRFNFHRFNNIVNVGSIRNPIHFTRCSSHYSRDQNENNNKKYDIFSLQCLYNKIKMREMPTNKNHSQSENHQRIWVHPIILSHLLIYSETCPYFIIGVILITMTDLNRRLFTYKCFLLLLLLLVLCCFCKINRIWCGIHSNIIRFS